MSLSDRATYLKRASSKDSGMEAAAAAPSLAASAEMRGPILSARSFIRDLKIGDGRLIMISFVFYDRIQVLN
jgi:hypothetical protein